MMIEVNMPASDREPEESKKEQKKYLWFGYGSYSGEVSAFQPTNIRAEPNIFDKLFELFGVKEKHIKESKEDADDIRDPSW
jgi:hypothetical protein